jgi:hypothetical protein
MDGVKGEELAILRHTDKKRSLFDMGREDRPHACVLDLWGHQTNPTMHNEHDTGVPARRPMCDFLNYQG